MDGGGWRLRWAVEAPGDGPGFGSMPLMTSYAWMVMVLSYGMPAPCIMTAA